MFKLCKDDICKSEIDFVPWDCVVTCSLPPPLTPNPGLPDLLCVLKNNFRDTLSHTQCSYRTLGVKPNQTKDKKKLKLRNSRRIMNFISKRTTVL